MLNLLIGYFVLYRFFKKELVDLVDLVVISRDWD